MNSVVNFMDVTIGRIKVEDSGRLLEVASAPDIRVVETDSRHLAAVEVVEDSETDVTAADLGPEEGTSKIT